MSTAPITPSRTEAPDGMRQILPDLWETSPFAVRNGPHTHAYLWTAPSGRNVLFYSPGSDHDFDRLQQLGGVTRQYLSHQDEAGPMLRAIAGRFGSRLHAPAAEVAAISAFTPIDTALSERGVDEAGVEVIPTPGHSPGSTCYLVHGRNERRYLFTGDTLLRYPDGAWRTGYIPGYSNREGLFEALDILAGVQPDFVFSSAFVDGAAGFHESDPTSWAAALRQARAAL